MPFSEEEREKIEKWDFLAQRVDAKTKIEKNRITKERGRGKCE
jgi:hypothetical protein